jgi:hypothetical protein
MPTFQCTKCRRKLHADYDLCVTGDIKRNVEKAPECCGAPMAETIDD